MVDIGDLMLYICFISKLKNKLKLKNMAKTSKRIVKIDNENVTVIANNTIKIENEMPQKFITPNQKVIETGIKIGSKYRFVSQNIDEVVTITESPIQNSCGFLEYGARNKDGVYRICFNDELFELETSDSTCI